METPCCTISMAQHTNERVMAANRSGGAGNILRNMDVSHEIWTDLFLLL